MSRETEKPSSYSLKSYLIDAVGVEDKLDDFTAKEETLSEFLSLLDYLKRKNEEDLKELFNAIRGPKHNVKRFHEFRLK